MKKLILALALISMQAHAEAETNHLRQVRVKYLCESMGDLAQRSYNDKIEGGTLEALKVALREKLSADTQEEIIAIVTLGYEADSKAEAYELGKGKCLDMDL